MTTNFRVADIISPVLAEISEIRRLDWGEMGHVLWSARNRFCRKEFFGAVLTTKRAHVRIIVVRFKICVICAFFKIEEV